MRYPKINEAIDNLRNDGGGPRSLYAQAFDTLSEIQLGELEEALAALTEEEMWDLCFGSADEPRADETKFSEEAKAAWDKAIGEIY